MKFNTIIYEELFDKKIAKITMNRPEKRNAMNKSMLIELSKAFTIAEANEDVRVIIINGNGQCFSAGHDLTLEDFPSNIDNIIKDKRKYYFDESLKIRNIRKPTIAQVHGHCIGAGLLLANLADILICSDDTIFSDPVVRMGASSQEFMILPWVVGEKKAKELLFTGDPLTADEAYQLGMVNHKVSKFELEGKVKELSQKIALMPPLTLTLVKESINQTMDIMGYSNSMNAHFQSHLLSFATSEMREEMDKSKRKNIKQFVKNRDQSFKNNES